MAKIAVITEGKSELMFTRNYLQNTANNSGVSIGLLCLEVRGSGIYQVPYEIDPPNPSHYFQIVNVGNDQRVMSYIRENVDNLVAKGFEYVYGIRDMFSQEYEKRANNIDNSVINLFIDEHNNLLNTFNPGAKKEIFFEIMEFEAWILSMPNLFPKINNQLTTARILKDLGFDISLVNPERDFVHPTNQLVQILNIIGMRYDKSERVINQILARIEAQDFVDATIGGKCLSLKRYIATLKQFVN